MRTAFPGTPRDLAPRRWGWARLLAAPHRLAFAAGTFMLVAASLWWAAVGIASNAGLVVRWSVPPSVAHSLLMTFGFMPLYFSGFLFTAGPKWLAARAVDARVLLPSVMAQLAGWAVFLLALHGRDGSYGQSVGAIGLAAVTVGWSGIVRRFVALLQSSPVPDRVHAKVIAVAGVCGVAALSASTWGVMFGDFALVKAAVHVGLWAFAGLVFASAAHRMIPFFSAAALPALDAWRPLWLLWTFVAVFVFEAAVGGVALLTRTTDSDRQLVRAVVEFVSGAGFLALAVRWGFVQNLRIRLLAMLHVGFTWLGVALLLSGVAHAVTAAGGPSGVLGLAPTHAYTMGFLGSTMFAMVTRVSCGHGGRTVAADDLVWNLFRVLQFAVAARLTAAIVVGMSAAWGAALVSAATVAWAGVVLVWGLRHGHWYGTPRPDGRAG